MAIAPRGFLVKSPRCVDPPKYGLLSAIDPINLSDPHWMASGIEWEDMLCGPSVTAFIDECPPATGFTKPALRDNKFCAAEPFVVVGSYDCGPVGRPSNEAFEIARQRLLAWEGRQVETTLWTGAVANGTGTINPSFAFGNPDCDILPEDVSPGGALDPVTALALLEERLGDIIACGGTIHLPYGIVTYLYKHHLLINNGGDEYYSPTGFRVIAGHGYPGSGPGNVAAEAGETWVFATGPLIIAEGPIIMVPNEVKEGMDRNINNITVRAEKFFSVGFSCVLLAVRMRLTCACC